MRTIQRIALALVIIGAINWGLIGFFKFDLVGTIFGGQNAFLARVIFALVGLSGLMCLTQLFQPMKDANQEMNRKEYGKPNYSTEFGEETDIVDLTENAGVHISKNKIHGIKSNKIFSLKLCIMYASFQNLFFFIRTIQSTLI